MVEDDDQELSLAEREQVLAGWEDARPTPGFAARVAAAAGAGQQPQPQAVMLGRPRRSRMPAIAAVVGALAAVAVVVMVVMMRRERAADARVRVKQDAARVLDDSTRQAERINADIQTMSAQIANANEKDRAILQERLKAKQQEMAAVAARAQEAKSKLGDRRGKPARPAATINLDVDTSSATGGIKGN